MGSLPKETLKRARLPIDLSKVKAQPQLNFEDTANPDSLINGMRLYAKYMDAARNGPTSDQKPEIPDSLAERAHQAKSLCYFMDAFDVGCASLTPDLFLKAPYINSDLAGFHSELEDFPTDRPGFHQHIAHGLHNGIEDNNSPITHHTHTVAIIYDHARELTPDEAAYKWLYDTGRHRGSIRASETAIVLANYLRALGFDARAHTESTTDVDLNKVAVASGIVDVEGDGSIRHPYRGKQFSIAAVTTTMSLEPDTPLAPRNALDKFKSHGPTWWLGGGVGHGKGMGTSKTAFNVEPYKNKSFETDIYGMSKIKRQDKTTNFIDEARVPRVPKRHDGFWRGYFGDLGPEVQANSDDEFCVIKSVIAEAQYGLIGPLHLIERMEESPQIKPGNDNPEENAKKVKSALHFLGADMVGISKAPDWVWYSHELDGEEIIPAHDHAITLLIDQGHETMEGASGDDWIASSQSMRAYMRGMLLGGILAEHIRSFGYKAQTHSVVDSDVLHMPLV
ncbi:MAG: NAD-binding oxidoreductase, partial [Litorimonas sp.]